MKMKMVMDKDKWVIGKIGLNQGNRLRKSACPFPGYVQTKPDSQTDSGFASRRRKAKREHDRWKEEVWADF